MAALRLASPEIIREIVLDAICASDDHRDDLSASVSEVDEFAALVLAGQLWLRFRVEISPDDLVGRIDMNTLHARVVGLTLARQSVGSDGDQPE